MHTDKSLGTILTETKQEFIQFITTRLNILKAEIDEKVTRLKAALPLLAVALTLLLSGWMAFTFALIALLHGLFMPGANAWLWASLVVTGAYTILGAAAGWFAYAEIKATSLKPTRTLKVLQQDQVWIQNEARTA